MKLSKTGMGTTKLNNIDEMYPGQSILLQTGQLVQYGAGLFGYNTIPLLLRRKIESIVIFIIHFCECEKKFGANAFGADYVDIFPVRADDFFYDRKSKSRSLLILTPR